MKPFLQTQHKLSALCLALCASCALPASASVVTGTLHGTGWSNPGTVDLWSITQLAAGTTTFDILSWNAFATFADTQIFLYAGSAATGTLLASNDDGPLGNDGSTSGLDSYLSIYLNAGDYTLAVATCCGSADAVRGGTQQSTYFYNRGANSYSYTGGATSAQYQLTVTGNALVSNPNATNAVPEPTSLALAGAALAGLVWVRRKR